MRFILSIIFLLTLIPIVSAECVNETRFIEQGERCCTGFIKHSASSLILPENDTCMNKSEGSTICTKCRELTEEEIQRNKDRVKKNNLIFMVSVLSGFLIIVMAIIQGIIQLAAWHANKDEIFQESSFFNYYTFMFFYILSIWGLSSRYKQYPDVMKYVKIQRYLVLFVVFVIGSAIIKISGKAFEVFGVFAGIACLILLVKIIKDRMHKVKTNQTYETINPPRPSISIPKWLVMLPANIIGLAISIGAGLLLFLAGAFALDFNNTSDKIFGSISLLLALLQIGVYIYSVRYSYKCEKRLEGFLLGIVLNLIPLGIGLVLLFVAGAVIGTIESLL